MDGQKSLELQIPPSLRQGKLFEPSKEMNKLISWEETLKTDTYRSQAHFVVVFLNEASQSKPKTLVWSNTPIHAINRPWSIIFVYFFPFRWNTCCSSDHGHGEGQNSKPKYTGQQAGRNKQRHSARQNGGSTDLVLTPDPVQRVKLKFA